VLRLRDEPIQAERRRSRIIATTPTTTPIKIASIEKAGIAGFLVVLLVELCISCVVVLVVGVVPVANEP
jgi:hypothetical protein